MEMAIQEVAAMELFEGLSLGETEHILEMLRTRYHRQGQFIFNTRQQANYLFVLQSGLVKVSYISPDGNQKILNICESGDIFGELFLGQYRYRIGQAQAMSDCTIYLLSEDDLQHIMRCYPIVGINFMRHLVDSHRRTMARMHALQRTDAKVRLLGTLLYLARHICCSQGRYYALNSAITQQDLADMTGLNRSTVSSLINRVRDEGLLGGSGRELTINKAAIEDALWKEGFELLE
jgi:CRP/FNR family transcriptional regulator, cyclic AMP receptor protein